MSDIAPHGIKVYFETELLDYALLIGMTEDEFWFGDPRLMDNFEKRFESQQKLEAHTAWLTGAYVKAAISSSVFSCGFYDKKKTLPKYPDFDFGESKKEEMTESEIEAARERAYLFFKNLQVQNSKKKRGGN